MSSGVAATRLRELHYERTKSFMRKEGRETLLAKLY